MPDGSQPSRPQSLIAGGGSKTVRKTVQTAPADCPCSSTPSVCVKIYSISADDTGGAPVAVFVYGYALVAHRTRGSPLDVAISALVFAIDPACRIAIPISVGVYGAIAISACRIARLIRVQCGALAIREERISQGAAMQEWGASYDSSVTVGAPR